MKRELLGTLWIGAVASGLALALQLGGLLARPSAAVAKMLGAAPNEPVSFVNFLLVLLLGFGTAWVVLQVTGAVRRAALLILLFAEIFAAAWVLRLAGINFAPLPGVIAVATAALLAIVLTATEESRQRRATTRLFGGRLAPSGLDRLTESGTLNLAQPLAREASFVFCEIANEADLIEELSPADCAKLTREFIECASERLLEEGGYLHAADGEGIRVLFGFPNESAAHAADAARAALAFKEAFRGLAEGRPGSLGKIDLRMGISSGTVVATMRDDARGKEIVVAGEPLEVARRLALANRTYGSEILLDPRAFSSAGKAIVARPLDLLRSVEAHQRLEVYELLALAEKATPQQMAERDSFWTAVVYFRERRWNEAFAEFNRARSGNGAEDRPLQWYLRRLEPLCLHMATEPAPVGEPLTPRP